MWIVLIIFKFYDIFSTNYYILIYASIAQLVECSLGKAEVTGSIPVRSPTNN